MQHQQAMLKQQHPGQRQLGQVQVVCPRPCRIVLALHVQSLVVPSTTAAIPRVAIPLLLTSCLMCQQLKAALGESGKTHRQL